MSTKLARVLVLVCTTRPGALGPAVGQWLTETLAPRAAELGAEIVPVSLGDLDLPFLDEEEHPSSGIYRHAHTLRWSAMVDAADGFIAVTPEYNYGMPAALKNALDYLGAEWAWKPIGFVSYGNTSAATLPLALAFSEAEGGLRPGDRVLIAAFGAGFTWGATVVEWGTP